MKLTAERVRTSSVVGSSVSLQNEQGAVVALLLIMVPSPAFPYRETAEPIADKLVELWNGQPAE